MVIGGVLIGARPTVGVVTAVHPTGVPRSGVDRGAAIGVRVTEVVRGVATEEPATEVAVVRSYVR